MMDRLTSAHIFSWKNQAIRTNPAAPGGIAKEKSRLSLRTHDLFPSTPIVVLHYNRNGSKAECSAAVSQSQTHCPEKPIHKMKPPALMETISPLNGFLPRLLP
jgi:hypothetical protein